MTAFNHRQTLNHAILEGAAKVSTHYGYGTLSDSLDITWYKDEDWIATFEDVLEALTNKEEKTLFGHRHDYHLSNVNGYFVIAQSNQAETGRELAKIPNYLHHDLFLLLTTLLKGNYDVSV